MTLWALKSRSIERTSARLAVQVSRAVARIERAVVREVVGRQVQIGRQQHLSCWRQTKVRQKLRLEQRQRFTLLDVILIRVHRLLVLAEVVEAQEVLGAVGTSEGAFACVLSSVTGQMLQTGKQLAAVGESGALEHPALQRALCFFVLVQHGTKRDIRCRENSDLCLYDGYPPRAVLRRSTSVRAEPAKC